MITALLLTLALGSSSPSAAAVAPAANTKVSHAAWHAADSVLYLEVPDAQGLRGAWWTTALGRMLADPEVHKALGAMTGQETMDPVAALMGLAQSSGSGQELAMAQQLLGALSAASLSVMPGEGAREAVASGVDDPAELLTKFGLQLTLTFASEEVAQQVFGMASGQVEAMGGQAQELRWNGQAGASVTLPEGALPVEAQLLRVGPNLTLLAGIASAEGLQARVEGSGASVATSEGWKRGTDTFATGGTTVAELYSDTRSFMPEDVGESSGVVSIFELAEGMFGTTGSMIARGGRWRVAIDGGRYITDGYQQRTKERSLERILGRGPLDAKALGFVNPKALIAWAVQFEPDALVEWIRTETKTEDGDAFSRMEANHGVKLAEMIGALGKSATFSMPSLPLMAAPDLQISLALEDRETVAAGLEPLIAYMQKMIEGKGSVTVKDYRDVKLTTVEFNVDLGIDELPVDPTKLIMPTIAVLEDRVLITMTQSFARKVVRNASKGELEPHPFLQTVSVPEGVSEFGYADWAKMIGNLYGMGRSMGQMAAASMEEGQLPVDLSKLPEADLFLRHFAPTVRWEKRVEGGMRHHSESSFGPDFMLALVAGGAAAALQAQGMGGF